MDQAMHLASDPLAGKLAGMINDITAMISSATGISPVIAKLSVQMPDDSVAELRVESCPDGCGQLFVTQAVIPRLPSAS